MNATEAVPPLQTEAEAAFEVNHADALDQVNWWVRLHHLLQRRQCEVERAWFVAGYATAVKRGKAPS